MNNLNPSPETMSLLREAPTVVLDDLLDPLVQEVLQTEAFHLRRQREGLPTILRLEPLPPRRRIELAIQRADLRCQVERGHQLRTLADYEELTRPEDPGRSAIYAHFGNWPHALLAARDCEHRWYANRRAGREPEGRPVHARRP